MYIYNYNSQMNHSLLEVGHDKVIKLLSIDMCAIKP